MKRSLLLYWLCGQFCLFSPPTYVAVGSSYAMLHKHDQLARILESGQLRVRTIRGALGYEDHLTGKPSGMEYELTQAFANYLGVKLELTVSEDLSELYANRSALNAVDLIAANQPLCDERLEAHRAGPPYYHITHQIVCKRGTQAPKTLMQLSGKIYVPAGSSQAYLLQQYANEHPSFQFYLTESVRPEDLLEYLQAGKIPYTVVDEWTLSHHQLKYPELVSVYTVNSQPLPVVWYLHRGQEDSLYAAIEKFFQSFIEEGRMARLVEKYFGHLNKLDLFDIKVFLSKIEQRLPNYRHLFEMNSTPLLPWKLLAAIAYQESHWDPKAVSYTGVKGMMMLTKTTAKAMGVTNRCHAAESIRGGAAYLSSLIDRLPHSIPEEERIWFALAAYNMGLGHLLDARRLAAERGKDPDSWTDVKQVLPLLGDPLYYRKLPYGAARGIEAFRYVECVRRYLQILNHVVLDDPPPVTKPTTKGIYASLYLAPDAGTSEKPELLHVASDGF